MPRKIKILYAAVILFMFMMACSDNDPEIINEPSEGQKEVEKIVTELEKNKDVSTFTKALKNIVPDLNFEENQITVLAVKNQSAEKSTDNTSNYTPETLKRHIVKGAHDFTQMSKDTLVLKSISNETIYATKLNGEIFINNVPLASTSPTKAGNSIIYVVNKTVPEAKDILVTKFKITLTVHECNEEWSADNNTESYLSEGATIIFYKKHKNKFVITDSIHTDKNGVGIYKHNYTDQLYYQIRKGDKSPILGGYIINGIFKSQEEIDLYPEYRTESELDVVKPGSIKLLDLNSDGFINKNDKLETEGYFPVEPDANETRYIIETGSDLKPDNAIYSIELLNKISNSLSDTFTSYLKLSYIVDYRLVNKPNDVGYPRLDRLHENSQIWAKGYLYIHRLLSVAQLTESNDYPKYLREEWDKLANKHWVEYSYIYSSLINLYGDIPLITKPYDTSVHLPRTPKADIIKHIQDISRKVSSPDASNGIKALLARYYLKEKDYAKANTLSKEIINSGVYRLISNNAPFDTQKNEEVIFGGYILGSDVTISKGKFAHPVRYKEVLLTMAESSLALGNEGEAYEIVSTINKSNGNTKIYESITRGIRNIWNTDMKNEGFSYTNLNRWDMLIETLGEYEAKPFNNLLPIPMQEIYANPQMVQNPGY